MAAFTIEARDGSSRRPCGGARDRARRCSHTGLRAARDEGHREGAAARGGGRAGVRDGARQHLPPAAQSRPRADRALRRDGPLHGLGRPDRDRFGRISGVLDGPRHGRRGDQAASRLHGARSRRAGVGSVGPSDERGRSLAIEEDGVRFRSYVDGRERLPLARGLDGDAGGAGLRSGARVRRVHAVPRRPRVHAALDRAHAPLAGALPGLARRARSRRSSSCTGSSRAASTRTCGASRRRTVAASACDGVAIGGSLGAEKAQMYEVVGYATRELRRRARAQAAASAGDRRGRRPDRGVELGIDTFDCAMPTRWAGTAPRWSPIPENRWRVDLKKAQWRESEEPLLEGCECPACSGGPVARLPQLSGARRRADRERGC